MSKINVPMLQGSTVTLIIDLRCFNSIGLNARTLDHNDSRLTKWHIQILRCVKGSSKSETKISRQTELNSLIVSQLITDLMEYGLVERTLKRKMRIYYKEYFSATLDGVALLETTRPRENDLVGRIISFLS
jgi:predicted transcriptional regulator